LHFFEDLTHFDSRFHKSLIPLLFKPGFLSKEYNEGKRTTYLNPVRMYVFVSLLYFLSILLPSNYIFTSQDKTRIAGVNISDKAFNLTTKAENDSLKKLNTTNTTIGLMGFNLKIKTKNNELYSAKMIADSVVLIKANYADSSWIDRISAVQSFKLSHIDSEVLNEQLGHGFYKNLPKMMFVLLPIFALLLKLIYIRRKVYFVDHAIFSIHFHCFVFINFLAQNIFDFISTFTFLIDAFLWIGLLIYLFIALKKVYAQSYLKTFLKYFSLLSLYSIIVGFALLCNYIITLLLI
jgi:hypothetical protein